MPLLNGGLRTTNWIRKDSAFTKEIQGYASENPLRLDIDPLIFRLLTWPANEAI